MAATSVIECPSCGTKNRVPVAAKGRPRCPSCKTDLPWLVNAGDHDLGPALDTDQVVLVDLWAPWCGPCRLVAPVLERLSVRYAGRMKVVKVNVDESPQAALRFDASSIPTLVLAIHGKVVWRVVGAQSEQVLSRAIDDALAGRPIPR